MQHFTTRLPLCPQSAHRIAKWIDEVITLTAEPPPCMWSPQPLQTNILPPCCTAIDLIPAHSAMSKSHNHSLLSVPMALILIHATFLQPKLDQHILWIQGLSYQVQTPLKKASHSIALSIQIHSYLCVLSCLPLQPPLSIPISLCVMMQ